MLNLVEILQCCPISPLLISINEMEWGWNILGIYKPFHVFHQTSWCRSEIEKTLREGAWIWWFYYSTLSTQMTITLLNELYSCTSFIHPGKFISNAVTYKFTGETTCACLVSAVCNGTLRHKRWEESTQFNS